MTLANSTTLITRPTSTMVYCPKGKPYLETVGKYLISENWLCFVPITALGAVFLGELEHDFYRSKGHSQHFHRVSVKHNEPTYIPPFCFGHTARLTRAQYLEWMAQQGYPISNDDTKSQIFIMGWISQEGTDTLQDFVKKAVYLAKRRKT